MEKESSHLLEVPALPAGENGDCGVVRPASAGYHPSVWGDFFILQHFPPSNIQETEEWIRGRVEELVAGVKSLLKSCDTHLQELLLIDSLQRLGVAYHFEIEIDETLRKIHNDPADDYSDRLNFGSLRFRLLRQHGYHVSSDIFCEFKDDEGHFKATLSNDARGLLSLYEAAYLSIPGESILDDAAKFSRTHLQSLVCNMEHPLAAQVSNSLHSPLRRRAERLDARKYIDIYQEDERNRNNEVLELAKLDFHLLQLLHREEVKIISKWWKELGLSERLTFARDRVVECYFWVLGVYFEPRYSRARLILTKVCAMFSLMDDIYDAYGTLEELRVYTEQIQRWDLDGLDQLNECIKLQYIALYDTINDFENELAMDQISYRVHYLKEAVKSTCRGWFKEAQWREEGYIPAFEEYLRISSVSSTYNTSACISFVGMGKVATKHAFEWILSNPKISQAACKVCRLMDDIVSQELEQKRVHVASSTQCYMKEHGASLQETLDIFREMIEDSWKEMNQECLTETAISMHLHKRIVNLARVIETLYKDYDAYTHSDTTVKDYITILLVQPVIL